MPLGVNEIAIDFKATTVMPFKANDNRPNNDDQENKPPEFQEIMILDNYPGKWIVLLFHPLAFTDISSTEIQSFSQCDNFHILNAQCIAISCDSIYTQLSWSKKMGSVKLPLVSDYSKEISQAYGVLNHSGMADRATFIISPSGVIRFVSIDDLNVGRSMYEVLRQLMALQHTDSYKENCPVNWLPGDNVSGVDVQQIREYFASIMTRKGLRKQPNIMDAIHNITAQVVNYLSVLQAKYNRSLKTNPLLTKSITSGVISVLGEIIGSFVKSNRSTTKRSLFNYIKAIDIKRVIIFALYGTCITGPVFHYWYEFLEKFVNRQKLSIPSSLGLKLALNQLVLTPPFLLLTLSYLHFVQSFSPHKTIVAIKRTFAMALYTNWKVWTPAQAINFSLVPLDYRVVYGNIVALWWNLYLSLVS